MVSMPKPQECPNCGTVCEPGTVECDRCKHRFSFEDAWIRYEARARAWREFWVCFVLFGVSAIFLPNWLSGLLGACCIATFFTAMKRRRPAQTPLYEATANGWRDFGVCCVLFVVSAILARSLAIAALRGALEWLSVGLGWISVLLLICCVVLFFRAAVKRRRPIEIEGLGLRDTQR
jgi:hypothetical protein